MFDKLSTALDEAKGEKVYLFFNNGLQMMGTVVDTDDETVTVSIKTTRQQCPLAGHTTEKNQHEEIEVHSIIMKSQIMRMDYIKVNLDA